jgi:hypothetical protein
MVYRSKVDWWLAVLLVGVPLVLCGMALALHRPGLCIVSVVVLALYGVAALPVVYETAAGGLLIRQGLLRRRISYSEIHAIRPSRSALASAALSLDRVEIEYGQADSVLISPENKVDFLKEMRTLASHAGE